MPSSRLKADFSDPAVDYREVLRRELARRQQRRPGYSQRAFARDLGLLPNRLSEILAGKQGLSARSASTVAERLGCTAAEQQVFHALVRREHARSQAEKRHARAELARHFSAKQYRELQLDVFRLVADWYHLAIVEMTKLPGFRANTSAIARALGIETPRAEEALQRLVRLGLLRKQGGRWAAGNNVLPGEVPSDSVKKFHQQILAKASLALTNQPVDRREFSATFLAVRPDQVALAKQRMREFWVSLDRELGGDPQSSAVYCLALQFFDVTAGAHDA